VFNIITSIEERKINMFIGFSKTLARFGGFRLGVGMRVTKNNVLWMSLIVMIIQMFKAMWYMMVVAAWFTYALFYGIIIGYKWLIKFFIWLFRKVVEFYKKREGNQA
jgi:hypothetical protein